MNTETTNLPVPEINIGQVSVPRSFHQLGLLVCDGSGSMVQDRTIGGICKSDAANDAIRGMLTRFKVSRYADDFSFGVISFDDHASLKTPVTTTKLIDDNGDYNPSVGHGGGTNIGAGLELAQTVALDFLQQNQNDGIPLSVVIVVMSDGMCGSPDHTRDVATRIKQIPKITVCATLFAQTGAPNAEMREAENLLRDVATDPVINYKTTYDAETLRKFFTASVSSSSAVKIQ
jgi:uncharacterized protein YegL